jgi:predicted DNA-binding protein
MLGIRLSANDERRLDRLARDLGRPKSVIARDWILERLERDSIDEQMRRAAKELASCHRPEDDIETDFDD